jgi:hypothetical protein
MLRDLFQRRIFSRGKMDGTEENKCPPRNEGRVKIPSILVVVLAG